MASLIWELSGPKRFLDTLVDDTRQGNSVVIGVPARHGDEVGRAVRDRLRASEMTVQTFPVEDQSVPPLLQLLNALGETCGASRPSVETISTAPQLAGQILWLDLFPGALAGEWGKFLTQYTHAARNVSVFERPLFMALAEGKDALDLPAPEIGLTTRRWERIVRRIDTLLLTDGLLSSLGDAQNGVERGLLIESVTALAGWDWMLAERLCAAAPHSVFNPEPTLSAYEKEVLPLGDSAPELWAAGLAEDVSGAQKHILSFSGHERMREVRNRAWAAQVSVLMPFIEECRLQIVEDLAVRLRPLVDEDARDVEVGELYSLVESGRLRADYGVVQRINSLRRLRNRLAHREMADLSELKAMDLFRSLDDERRTG